jgi:hypothetical protein
MDTDMKYVSDPRAAVEKQLRRRVSDEVWEWIEEDGYARDVSPEEIPTIAQTVRRWERRIPPAVATASPNGAEVRPENKPDLSGTQIEARAQLLAAVYAMKAAESLTVSRFRTDFLDNRIDETTACAFIASPATRYLTPRVFREHCIPFLNHTASLVRDETVEEWRHKLGPSQRRTICVFVDPPGIRFLHGPSFSYGGNFKEPPVLRLPERVFRLLSAEQLETMGLYNPPPHSRSSLDLPIHEGSILNDLRIVGDWLGKGYGWEPADAAWFVLTGEVPPIRLGTASGRTVPGFDHWGISFSLNVDLAATAEEVAEFYKSLQRQFVSSRQRPSPKGERLVRFVVDQGLPRPSWRELQRRWNETHTDRPYNGEAGHRNLKRDYERALDRLLFPELDDYRDMQKGHVEIAPSRRLSEPAWLAESEHVQFEFSTPKNTPTSTD